MLVVLGLCGELGRRKGPFFGLFDKGLELGDHICNSIWIAIIAIEHKNSQPS